MDKTKYLDEGEKVLITFPLLFGWIIGIIKYPVKSQSFQVAFHSGLLAFIFLGLYGSMNSINAFFDVPEDNIMLIIQTVLSSLYLAVSFGNYFFYRTGKNIPGIKFTQSLLDRLFQGLN